MKHSFKAKIYRTGINWCVDVPLKISRQMNPERGYIRITGRINGFDFRKSLVPVKDAPYRLYVNAEMMKGGKTALGSVAIFEIEQSHENAVAEYPLPGMLTKLLKDERLTTEFDSLTSARKREILKYLNYIKTEETLQKNIDKLIKQLKIKSKNVRIP